jgi:hypothetical protein
MNRKALALLLPLLAGCNAQMKNPSNGNENVTINADESGHIAFNLPFVQGQVKVPTSMMHNGSFDIDGVRLMPGSAITGLNVNAGDNGSTVNLSFSAPVPPEKARAYFLDQFKEKGVEASLSSNEIKGKSRDGSPFTIDIGPGANGSKGTILIQSKD